MNKSNWMVIFIVAFLGQISTWSWAADADSGWVKVAEDHPYHAEYRWSSGWNKSNDQELVIKRSGASFLKVHFSHLVLPDGMRLVISNASGTERYQYDGGKKPLAHITLQEGKQGFSAMSISADTVYLRIEGKPQGNDQASIQIDGLQQGFSAAQLKTVLDAGPLSTCGSMERRDVMCWAQSYPRQFERTRPTAKLLFNGGVCSAWRVGPDNRIMTNNHCISSPSAVSGAEVWFNYQYVSCDGNTLAPVTKVTGNSLLATDYKLDFTLFTVNNFTSIAGFGYYGLDVREPTQGEGIFIPQHGAGNPKEMAIESDRNSSGRCEIDVPVTNGYAVDSDTGYLCDTYPGSSGSPVLAEASNRVIALHHFGGCPNQGVLVARIWPKISDYFDGIPDNDNGNNNQAPVADFSYQVSGLNVSFNNASRDSDGTIVSYDWDFGDGNSASNANPQHRYASAGRYSVVLEVRDNDGLSARKQVDIIVDDQDAIPVISPGQRLTDLSANQGDWLRFKAILPASATNLNVRIFDGTGDADLYMRADQVPTVQEYDCRPYTSGNSEQCNSSSPQAGTYYFAIRAFRRFSGLSLEMNYQSP